MESEDNFCILVTQGGNDQKMPLQMAIRSREKLPRKENPTGRIKTGNTDEKDEEDDNLPTQKEDQTDKTSYGTPEDISEIASEIASEHTGNTSLEKPIRSRIGNEKTTGGK